MSYSNDKKVSEYQVLERFLLEDIQEKRRRRIWYTSIRIITIVVLLGISTKIFDIHWSKESTVGKHTALIDLQGEIVPNSKASADNIVSSLKSAFENPNSIGVLLRVNSPGGSPVQAGIIHDEIKRLRNQYNKPIYVVVEEICTSGGYYVAVAADKIYVDKASLIGSVGVVMSSFGIKGLMDKLGIERRLLIAGKNKALMDPFSRENKKQKQFIQETLNEVHQQFISIVKNGRGIRLKKDLDIFSGLIWTGSRSIELGLVDALGNVDFVARDVIKAPEIIDYTLKENLAERFAKKFGAAIGTDLTRILLHHQLK